MAPSAHTGAKTAAAKPARQRGGGTTIDYGSLPRYVGYLLRLAQLRVWDDFYARIGGTGISPALFSALVLIERNPGLQQSRLGEALGVARSGAMTMVDRLERLGIVERRAAPHDRRAYGLFLTARGEREMAGFVALVRQHDAVVTAALTEDEHQTLMILLHKFIAAPAQRGEDLSGTEGNSVASRQKRPGRSPGNNGRQTTPREERP